MSQVNFARAAAMLDAWFETMRSSTGYTGPVVHWWQNCLVYTGVGLDWRYEGVIAAYLTLYEKTHAARWLEKARRAGDDLVNGQLETGNYRHSSFELNPYPGGTPHEAAASLGLLMLADALKRADDDGYQRYLITAKRSLEAFAIGLLWDEVAGYFRDNPSIPSFVPNKAATLSEALFKLSALIGDDHYINRYALPTLRHLLRYQVRTGTLAGAVAQNVIRGVTVAKYFPYYAARCVPALLLAYDHTGEAEFLDAALMAVAFIFRQRTEDGGFAQVVYGDGRVNRYQQWIAGAGDILRIAHLAGRYGLAIDTRAPDAYLLAGIPVSGGIASAHGFGAQINQRKPSLDFRDILPVCGWADKAFRYVAERLKVGEELPHVDLATYTAPCAFRGQPMRYTETTADITLMSGEKLVYHWRKGEAWPRVCAPIMLWK